MFLSNFIRRQAPKPDRSAQNHDIKTDTRQGEFGERQTHRPRKARLLGFGHDKSADSSGRPTDANTNTPIAQTLLNSPILVEASSTSTQQLKSEPIRTSLNGADTTDSAYQNIWSKALMKIGRVPQKVWERVKHSPRKEGEHPSTANAAVFPNEVSTVTPTVPPRAQSWGGVLAVPRPGGSRGGRGASAGVTAVQIGNVQGTNSEDEWGSTGKFEKRRFMA